MANPQRENGYTGIANEILDKLAETQLNGTQFRIVMVVFRNTYGFRRKEHELSETFLSKATGIHRQQIKRELRELIDRKILIVIRDNDFTNSRVMSFNKDHDQWVVRELKRYQGAKKIPGSELDTTTGSEKDTTLFPEDQTQNTPETYSRADFRGVVSKKVPGSEKDTQERNIFKENIKESMYTQEFLNWYSIYPNPWHKEQSFKNWKSVLKNETIETIILATRKYIKYLRDNGKTERRFIIRSTNFIGQHQEYKAYLELEENKPNIPKRDIRM